MKIVIGGSSGMVGTALIELIQSDHEIVRLVRREPKGDDEIRWYPNDAVLQSALIDGVDAVVHLGGDNIAEGRWTAAKKKKIRESRVESTKLLSESLAKLENKPKVFVCASAIGFYGNRGDEALHEGSAPGSGFLAEVCQAWEAATAPAREAGIRVVNLRIGVVLSTKGGALSKMLLPFRLGLGGVMGSGKQYWSCVSLAELTKMIQFALVNDSLEGPVNAVSCTVTNREFTKALGRVIGRPTLFPMPAFAARLAFGEMGDELMLASTRVEPQKLTEAGYVFADGNIEASLRSALA